MGQISNIAVYDGAATPVLHTLVPISVEKTGKGNRIEAVWREQLSTLPTYAQVSAKMSLSRNPKSGIWHVDFSVGVPVMESVAGANAAGYTAAPKVAYVDTSGFYGHYHERGNIAGRRLSKQLLINVLNNTSASVPPISAGIVDELAAQLICVS